MAIDTVFHLLKQRNIVEPLINEAWKVAGQPENRELTRLRFLKIFEEKTKRLVSEQYLQYMETLVAMKGAVGTGFIGRIHLILRFNLSLLYIQYRYTAPLYLQIIAPQERI